MIAVDTQLLVYAHRGDSEFHARARPLIDSLSASGERWAIAVHSLVEFYATVTRKYRPASTPAQATAQIDAWQESGGLVLLTEDERTWSITRELVLASAIRGPHAYDARIAAVCLQHGITELWTTERDFADFRELRARNPLVEQQPTHAGEVRAAYAPRARAAKPVPVTPAKRTPIEYPARGQRRPQTANRVTRP